MPYLRPRAGWLIATAALFVGLIVGIKLGPEGVYAGTGVALSTGDLRVLPPVEHEGLTLYPVVRDGARDSGTRYLTLDEGTAAGTVRVVETGTVSRLTIVNDSDRTLFVLAGEMVVGGKQDRIIAANVMIRPGTRATAPAFCVEHGRWDRGGRFGSARGMVHRNLRRIAQSKRSQQAVWSEVADTNSKMGTSNQTSSYRDNFRAGHALAGQESYVRALEPALARIDGLVGFCVAVNGELRTAEVFRDPALFAVLRGKLLRSYAIEALRERDRAATAAPPLAQASAFLERAQRMQETERRGITATRRAPGYVGFETFDESGDTMHMTAELDK